MEPADIQGDLTEVLLSEAQIHDRIAELCREIERDYEGRELLLVGVLKGAVMVMADVSRELRRHIEMDWMAVSSYGAGTQSSGVVRILKDLDTDLTNRDVLIIEDIIDSGLTLSWLRENLSSRPVDEILLSGVFDETQPFNAEISALIEQRHQAIEQGDKRAQQEVEAKLLALNPQHFAYFKIDEMMASMGLRS